MSPIESKNTVTSKNYVPLAMRTKCSMEDSKRRLSEAHPRLIQFLHAMIGVAGESGEMASAVEKHIFYGQPFNIVNAKEEIGDLLWRIAEACDALEITLEEAMEANIRKLSVRYPEKFTEERALEENRDRAREARAIDDGVFYEEGGAE